MLKEVYNADATALIPGGGTYGMEAVARQLAATPKCWSCGMGGFPIVGARFLKPHPSPQMSR